jgi:putative peptide zinc metalloprotease protein
MAEKARVATDGDDVTAPLDLGGERLQLADGIELLGKYKGSGFKEAPYLVKRSDGQVVQVTELIYLVATCLAAGYHLHQVAVRVSEEFGRTVSVENVAYLVNQKLRPAGLIASARGTGDGDGDGDDDSDDDALRSPRANALLALKLRVPLVPARVHGTVTRLLLPLFRLPVVGAGLVGMAVMNLWLFGVERQALAAGVRDVIFHPQLVLVITVLTLVAGVFHETGHATAARFGGATPGAMGAGIYLVWPVFYTDVTDSYRLDRAGRLRTDLGGVYFNGLFTLGVTAGYLATGFRPLLVFLVVAELETLRQFLPFVRLDGYYVVSDLAGVPNLFAYLQPVLLSIFKRRDPATRHAARTKLDELKPRARRIIAAWVALTVPVLLGNVVILLLVMPRLAGAAWGSAGAQWRQLVGATPGGFDPVAAANGLLGLGLILLPVVGMFYITSRVTGRVLLLLPRWWARRPSATAFLGAAAAALAAWQIGFVWPDAFAKGLAQAQRAEGDVTAAADQDLITDAGPLADVTAVSVTSGDDVGTTLGTANPGSAVPGELADAGTPATDALAPPRPADSTTAGSGPALGSQLPPSTGEVEDPDDEPHGGGAEASPGTTGRTTAPPPPSTPSTTADDNPLADLVGALFGRHH